MPKRAFAIAAHPDDIEFVMAGTLLLLADAGYEIHYLNLADGCCGSTVANRSETARIRRHEAIEACKIAGAVFHESLTHDLEIFYDKPILAKLAAIVRQVAPEIVLTHSPVDYMEDHVNACRLAVTASFARGMPNFHTDPPTHPDASPVTIYHAQPHGNRDPLGELVRPGIFVSVTSKMAAKAAMLAAHQSQKQWLDESQGLGSYLQAMHDLMREVGEMSGHFLYAEGWRKRMHLGFCPADADPLIKAVPAELVLGPTSAKRLPP